MLSAISPLLTKPNPDRWALTVPTTVREAPEDREACAGRLPPNCGGRGREGALAGLRLPEGCLERDFFRGIAYLEGGFAASLAAARAKGADSLTYPTPLA
jgi:hypothetical protein